MTQKLVKLKRVIVIIIFTKSIIKKTTLLLQNLITYEQGFLLQDQQKQIW